MGLSRGAGTAERTREITDVPLWESDPYGLLSDAGGRLLENLGYTPADIPLLTLHDLLQPKAGAPALGDHENEQLTTRVTRVLENGSLRTLFQPILSVSTGLLVGAEALTRFDDPGLTPEEWFLGAARVGLGTELDLLALDRALATAPSLPTDVYVSLNVSPATLLTPRLRASLAAAAIPPSRVVVEITEHAAIPDYESVLAAIAALRADGVRVAVDDVGAGYSSFRHILRLGPEHLKLDRSLIVGIDHDPARRALASAVVLFGLQMNSTIVAEGVETTQELRTLQDLGIDAVQGNLLGLPTQNWDTWNEWHRHGALFSVRAASRATA